MKTNFLFTTIVFIFCCFLAENLLSQDKILDPVQLKKGDQMNYNSLNRNQNYKDRLLNIKNIGSELFFEDFESVNSIWTLEGEWEIGEPSSGPLTGNNGSSSCLATNLNGNYQNYANYRIISHPINLPPSSNIIMSFWDWFVIESGYDGGYCQISNDGGNTWINLLIVDGTQTVWSEKIFDLSGFAGDQVQLSFLFQSDYSVTYDGWYIDDINIQTIEEEPITVTIINLNSQNFPFIYSNINVDSMGYGTPNLTQSNFQVFENGVLQTDYFEVTPPDTGSSMRLADIIFIVDNSGSFEDYQAAVYNNLYDFIDALIISDIDFALGLCRFGAQAYGGDPIIEDAGELTQNAIYFRDDVWLRNVTDGSTEPAYYAITESSTEFNFRPGSQKVFIIMADEDPDQGGATYEQAINDCLDNSINLFALTTSESAELNSIATLTNGNFYNITDPFEDILDDISNTISNTYLIKHKSSDPYFNGILRLVEIKANYLGEQGSDTTSYIPGAFPKIYRTNGTIALHNQAWPENTEFQIEVYIRDFVEPFVQEATLYYKTSTEGNFASTWFDNISDSLWSATIPSSAVNYPGLDYYVTASDGQSTSSLPAVNPSGNPFQLAILPNVAPVISHIPINILSPGIAIVIQANISDNTNGVEYAGLYYRKIGQLIYQEIELNNTSGENYQAIIPTNYVTDDGVEYYLWAKDDYNIGTFHGTPDMPHVITSAPSFEAYLSEKSLLIYEILNYERPFPSLFPDPVFTEVENDANNYLSQIINANNNGTADPLDLEAIARLTLSERVTLEAVDGVHEISDYGAKGTKSLLFTLVIGKAAKKIGDLVKNIIPIGNPLSKAMYKVSDKMNHALFNYYAIYQHHALSHGGQLTLSQSLETSEWTTKALAKTEKEVSEAITENSLLVIPDLMDDFEALLQDAIFIWPFEQISKNHQEEALENALNHNFNTGDFPSALVKTSQKYNSLVTANNIANFGGNFHESLRMVAEWAIILGIIVLVILAVGAAITGAGIPAAIAGFAALVIKAGSLLSLNTAIVESAGALLYADGIVPFVYLNPSADLAFDPNSKTFEYKEYYKLDPVDYKEVKGTSDLISYYIRLKEKIENKDPEWATIGMDSLEHYENLARRDFQMLTAKFFAASDSAAIVINDYQELVDLSLVLGSANELYSSALNITSGVYLAGYGGNDIWQNSLDAIDSAIFSNIRTLNLQTNLNNLLEANNIPTPSAIGVGKIFASQLYPTKKLKAEIINFGDNSYEIPVELYISNEGIAIISPEKYLTISGGETKHVEFEFVTSFPSDSIITGYIAVVSSEFSSYFAMPGKIFTLYFSESSLGMNTASVKNENIIIYPNPSNQYLIVDAINFKNIEEIIIYNMLGNVVLKENITGSNENTAIIDILHLTTGTYAVKVLADGIFMTKKIVIK